MAISLTNLGTATSTSGASVAVSSVTVPSGSLIVVCVNDLSSSSPAGSVSDTVNTYSAAAGVNNNGQSSKGFGRIFYAANASLSSKTITYTKAVSGSVAEMSAFYATGIATSSPQDSAVTATASSVGSTVSVTSGTPSVAGELFVGVFSDYNSTSFTQDTTNGWSSPPNSAAGTSSIVAGGTQVNSGTGTKTFAPSTASSQWGAIIVGFKPGNQAYTLAGAEGSFSISGQAATPAVGMPGAEGAFTISGQNATLGVGLPGAEGAFSISGQSATLGVGMPGSEGAFTISGQSATLAVGLPNAEGAFVISGGAATLGVGIGGAEGAFVISGQSAALNSARVSAGAEGAFVISGQLATVVRGHIAAGSEGAFLINGDTAGMTRTIGVGGAEGAFVISGGPVTPGLGMPGIEGAFVISGQNMAVRRDETAALGEGAFVINGTGAVLTYTPAGGGGTANHSNPFFASPGRLTAIP